MRHLPPVLLLAFAGNALAQDNPWIWFPSAETGTPPQLVLELQGGAKKVLNASEDTILIAYIGDSAFAKHAQLAIDTSDENHSLVRFDVPGDLQVTRAQFVTTMHPSNIAPPGDTTFRVHMVEGPWDASTTWNKSPPHAAADFAVGRVPFGGGPVSIDVTEAVAKWQKEPAKNFGILLRGLQADGEPKMKPPESKPGAPAGETPMQKYARQQQLNKRLASCLPWQKDAGAARKLAEADGKLVLAFVIADVGPAGNAHERALAVTSLLDPDVRALIEERFVPVRLATFSGLHLGMKMKGGDPLEALGTDAVTAKAPALVVSTAGGQAVAVLASIGTWSRQLVAGFLLHALAGRAPAEAKDAAAALKQGDLARARALAAESSPVEQQRVGLHIAALRGDVPAAREAVAQLQRASALAAADVFMAAACVLAMREGEGVEAWLAGAKDADPATVAWLRGELAWLQRDEQGARREWLRAAEAAPPESSLRLRAELRMEYALGIDEVGAALPVAYAPAMTTTERARAEASREPLVQGAIAWLLGRQQSDGRFAHASMDTYDAAVTSLCGKALHAWGPRLPQALRARADAALERVEAWCGGYLRRADPKTADSFGAGYLVDFLAARAAGRPAAKELVPAAIELLLAGQLKTGAWSYSQQFGEGWVGGFGGWPKTDKGRAHSINTGIALWALANARAAGFAVDEERVKAGVQALEQMKETATTFTYTWPDPRCFTARDQSIGKAPVCVQALAALGAVKAEDLEQTAVDFMHWREGLRKTAKLTPSWIGPSGTSSYFFLHSYYHGAEAVVAAGGDDCARRLETLSRDLLACAEADGTWLDFEESGKTYSTAMALLVLARAR
ncbi:MAG TPA: DNRLRE domain-containing protein [Planctomycetota bacterium]